MNLGNMDVVYFVKATLRNPELRYSLRSIEKNFPHNRVWFVGYCPRGFKPDVFLDVKQDSNIKWENTSLLFKTVCKSEELTDDFVLFNDDFFVLRDVEQLPYYSCGTLESRSKKLLNSNGSSSKYGRNLLNTANLLISRSLPTINYAVHYPIIINKHEMNETFEEFPEGLMWRSIYGNHHHKPNVEVTDCKIRDNETIPSENSTYVSTEDASFLNGDVGEFLRDSFNTRSRYERSWLV